MSACAQSRAALSDVVCGDRLVGKAHGEHSDGSKLWAYRFGAPTGASVFRARSLADGAVATNYSATPYPLAPVRHSADNSYLQNRTAVMTDFERPIALELRGALHLRSSAG